MDRSRLAVAAAQGHINRVKRLFTIAAVLLCLAAPARAACGANEGQKWRNEMQALIDAEAPNGERRRKIVTKFNRGYRGYQQTYRTCTPAPAPAIRRYRDEGPKTPRKTPARYKNYPRR